MRIKTSDLTGAALDWAVAKCQPELHVGVYHKRTFLDWFKSFGYLSPHGTDTTAWAPSNDWSQGGPIIEREGIAIDCVRCEGEVASWVAALPYVNEDDDDDDDEVRYSEETGPTPLVAAMRCFVVSRLGEEVEVPDELA